MDSFFVWFRCAGARVATLIKLLQVTHVERAIKSSCADARVSKKCLDNPKIGIVLH